MALHSSSAISTSSCRSNILSCRSNSSLFSKFLFLSNALSNFSLEVLSWLEDILLRLTSSHLSSITSDIPQTALEVLPSISSFSFSLLLRVSIVFVVPNNQLPKQIRINPNEIDQ
ncbi:hypothetical protein MS3_00008264 [Schistosoma haematobium]|uniref:Uncharacterized protein n=1 Tax=Schistosoma haematobium TaxID=6185 RepID=A0A922IJG9_SCHHA|nr:hypothetical protein MS3_00008264 [Schistosoma haematobium]KAH9580995.1 hypothetical protein MS3_00008264 [Schistosoma haematobium]